MTCQGETMQSGHSRNGLDRRHFSWRTVAYGYTRSRRRNHRRDADATQIFIDWHHPWLFFLAVGTMLLSTTDAFLTLKLINLGAIEVNPVMAVALNKGSSVFVISKLCLTAFAILTLVYLSRSRFFNILRTGLLLTSSFSVYACLICYQFLLLMQGP